MILPSSILAIFSRHGGTQTPLDSELYVPNELRAFLEVPAPVLSTDELNTDASLRQASFQRDASVTVANAAAVDQAFFTLAPGLWDVTLVISQLSNYTNIARKIFVYANGSGVPGAVFLFSSAAITNVIDRENISFRIAVANAAGYTVFMQVAANGVGESSRLDVAAICNRMA